MPSSVFVGLVGAVKLAELLRPGSHPSALSGDDVDHAPHVLVALVVVPGYRRDRVGVDGIDRLGQP